MMCNSLNMQINKKKKRTLLEYVLEWTESKCYTQSSSLNVIFLWRNVGKY